MAVFSAILCARGTRHITLWLRRYVSPDSLMMHCNW
jgi:hypothetical protein